ncbi:MAG: SusD/RagB family nutrient-binding outer membrane lipoprotein [Prevotella sp.]|jgi:hypothetical protein
MKPKNIGKLLVGSLAGLMLSSCLDFDVTGAEFSQTEKNESKVVRQGKVDSINYKVSLTEAQFDAVMNKVQTNMSIALGGLYGMRGGKEGNPPVSHAYQYYSSFYQDAFAQYGVIPHVNYPYSGINIVSSSAIDLKAYGGAYGAYHTCVKSVVPLLNMEEIDSLPEIKATYLLFFDMASVECVDNYGPMPYQDFKTNKQKRPFTYDNLETIYNTVVANIDTIVACYDYFEQNRPDWYKKKVLEALSFNTMCSPQIMDGGFKNLDALKRFANSLKLRMAMHIVKVDPDKAKRWAEESVASGVIETEEQEMAFMTTIHGAGNPLKDVWNSWGDMRLGAGFEQVLKAYNHPFLETLFTKNDRIVSVKGDEYTLNAGEKVCGILAGAHVGQEQNSTSNPYNGFSKLNEITIGSAPIYLMKLSEVCFLRAEGAVRGWNMQGSAKEFYEKGIREGNFMDRKIQIPPFKGVYEAAMDDYLQIEKAAPFTYVDPTGNDEDRVSEITVGVKWDDGDDREVKLEKIITQKYIAGFPNSIEAWVDLRRTGYPRLFKMLNLQDGDGSLQDGDIVRRLPFPDSADPSTKKDIDATGMEALGAPDKQSTRLWWDVDAPNF